VNASSRQYQSPFQAGAEVLDIIHKPLVNAHPAGVLPRGRE
jgi:hypothetical protein